MNSLKNLLYLCLIFSCLFPTSTTAQNCLNFETLTGGFYYNGNNYNSGDVIFTENDIKVHIEEFYYQNGGSDMWGILVDTSDIATLPITDNAIWISNTSAKFDFSNLNYAVNSISFDYWDGGGEINFSINDQNVILANHLSDLPTNIAPGITLVVNQTGFLQGEVLLQGPISNLSVGGQEFLLDNLCASNTLPDCQITMLTATAQDCTPNNVFYVDISFDHTETVSDSFKISGNGNHYGDFAYGQDSYTIGPFTGDGTTTYEFIVADLEHPNCQAFTSLDSIDCDNQNFCEISELFVEAHEECNEDGTFDADIEFQVINDLSGFNLYVDYEFHSYHQGYPNPTITVPSLALGNGQVVIVEVVEEGDPNCTMLFTLIAPDCNNNNDCHISEVNATALECDPNNSFFVEISFEYSGMVSDSFKISGNGNHYGNFAYGQDSYIVGPFLATGNTPYEFIVSDLEFADCQAFTFIKEVDCSNQQDCQIFEFFVEAYEECNEDGTFDADLQFIIENGLGAGFDLYVNNEFHSYYQGYPDPFVTIPSLALGNGQTIVVTVKDNDNPDCQASFTLIAPDCNNNNDCHISELTATALECDPNNYFFVEISFEYAGMTSDSFKISGNGNHYGNFAYGQDSYFVGPFIAVGNTTYEFVVTDLEYDNCQAFTAIEEVDCSNQQDCQIFEFFVEAYEECNEDGTFDADLQFIIENGLGAGFDLYVNEEFHSYYQGYPDPFVTIPSLALGNGQTIVVTVKDNDNPDCQASFTLIAPDCDNNNDCHISELTATALECDPNNYFFVEISFEYAGMTSDSFKISGNGNHYGNFAYGQDSYFIGPFLAVGNTPYEFIVSDLEYADCQAFTFIKEVDCSNQQDCQIFEFFVEAYEECNEDGTFDADLQFIIENGLGAGFDLYVNNEFHSYYQGYPDPFVTIPSLALGNGQTIVVTVKDNDNPDCQASFTLIAPDCNNNNDCHISELTATALECDPNNYFFVEISFEYSGMVSDSFKIFGNGNHYGNFTYGQDSYIVGPFLATGNTPYEFIVSDLEYADCQAFTFIKEVDCSNQQDCQIFEFFVEAYDECNEDGTFDADLQFIIENGLGAGFDLYVNEEFHSYYQGYPDPFVTIPSLALGNGQTIVVTVKDNDNPDCQASFTLIAPDCNNNNDCQLSEVSAEAVCDGNDYYVSFDFEYQNTSDLFYIQINGINAGPFSYNLLPFNFGPIPSGGNNVIDFLIFDSADESCSIDGSFTEPNCQSDCTIYDVVAEPQDCTPNGVFYVDISFEVDSPASQSFQILGNGSNYGSFDYGQSVYTVGPLVGDGTSVYEFIVQDLEDSNCQAFTSLGPIDCENPGDCHLSNLQVFEIECQDDGTYTALVNFSYLNTAGVGFDIWSGDTYLGTYSYQALPISITSSGDYMDEITVCDNDNEDCCISYIFDLPCGDNCVGFNYIPWEVIGNSTGNTPGSTLTNEDVHVTLESFEYSDGTTGFFDLYIGDDILNNSFTLAEDQYVFASNINLKFDFTVLSYVVNSIDLVFYDGGGDENISVNGNPIIVVNSFTDLPSEIAPGISASVSLDPSDNQMGVLTISGDNISSLIIGGQELGIDNVCFNQSDQTGDVWPGDANTDNIANHFDLLNVGIAFNSTGNDRNDQDIQWYAHLSEDWDNSFEDGTNYKHADTNGDGVVDINDQNAIIGNYDLTHGIIEDFIPIEGSPNDPPFFVDLPEDGLPLGEDFSAPIILGTDANPINNIYGIAFTIKFDPHVINPNSVEVVYANSWLEESGGNLISMDKSYADDGLIEVAISRTDQENIDGFGALASFKGVIEDDILGKTEMEIEIIDVKAIQYDEMQVPLYKPTIVVNMEDQVTKVRDFSINDQIKVSPNPTSGIFRIINLSSERIEQIQIYDSIGKLVSSYTKGFDELSLENHPAGIYWINIDVNGETVHQRIIKQ